MLRVGGRITGKAPTYGRNRRDRSEHALQFVMVSAFPVGVSSRLRLALPARVLSALVMLAVAVIACQTQGLGHRRETEAPISLQSAIDPIGLDLTEWFIASSQFVFTSGWTRQLSGRQLDQR